MSTPPLPIKTSDQQWSIWDSTRLDDFKFRNDDIMIGTWSKSGTTWMQQLVAQLIFKGDPSVYGQVLSPWVEFRVMPKEEAFAMAEEQTHRRFLKTHSPLNCIPYVPDVHYLFVGRDPRDVVWSMYHHHVNFRDDVYPLFNNAPGLIGPPLTPPDCDVKDYYLHFLEHGFFKGFSPDVPFWPNIQSWWDAKGQPNIKLLHFTNLKNNFENEARDVASFLDIDIEESLWPQIIKHCSIDYMRELANKEPALEQLFEGGGTTFINKGTNGRWKDILSADEIARCDELAAQNLTEDCAHWIKTGEMP